MTKHNIPEFNGTEYDTETPFLGQIRVRVVTYSSTENLTNSYSSVESTLQQWNGEMWVNVDKVNEKEDIS